MIRFILYRERRNTRREVAPIEAIDLGTAAESAILWLNSHLAPAGERADDEEPERYERPSGEIALVFRRGGRRRYVVRAA